MKKTIGVLLFLNFVSNRLPAQLPYDNDPTWVLNTTVSDELNGGWDPNKFKIGINNGDWRNLYICACYGGITPSQLDFSADRTNTTNNYAANSTYFTIITKAQPVTVYNKTSQCNSNYTQCAPNTTIPSFTRPYTSLQYFSSTKAFKYGIFEVRAKVPLLAGNSTNNGLGANFWMTNLSLDPATNTPCTSNEIDIFEILGYKPNSQPNYPAKHEWGLNSHYGTNIVGCGECYTLANDGDWHTWAINWTPLYIDYYFDGTKIFTSTNNPGAYTAMQILLDVNVFKGLSSDATTVNPYNFDIDYVRIYSPNTTAINTCFYNDISLISSSVYQCIKLGDAYSSNATVSNSSSTQQNLHATDYIILDKGFTFDKGTTSATFKAEVQSAQNYPTQLIYSAQ